MEGRERGKGGEGRGGEGKERGKEGALLISGQEAFFLKSASGDGDPSVIHGQSPCQGVASFIDYMLLTDL